MMKNVIYLFLCLLQINLVYAQHKTIIIDTVYNSSEVPIDKNKKWVGEIGLNNAIFAKTYPNVEIKGYIPDDRSFGIIHYLTGANQIEIFANLPKDSVKYFRYSVIANEYTVLSTDKVPLNTNNKINFSNKIQVSLGKYDIVDKKIALKLYTIYDKNKSIELCFYNKPIGKLRISKATFVEYPLGENNDKVKRLNNAIITANSHDIMLKVQGLDKNVPYSIGLIREFDNKKDTTYRNATWVLNDFGTQEYDCKVYGTLPRGKYRLVVFPYLEKINSKHSATVNFEIATPLLTIKRILFLCAGLLIFLTLIFCLVIYFVKKKNKRLLLQSTKEKDIAKIQLSSIRSQLNPHFMFNALAGIQSLMNEEKTNEANQYLGRFARITRNVLDNRELISLEEEKILLDDYLQMEQLRFGFNYQIEIQQDVDLNIEIPAMLLQPFVENAVEHGIAEKGKDGEITINFIKEDNSLVLEIRDNGKGFDTSKTYAGYGLQLSKNRFMLLNSIYKENILVLDMSADDNGTVIKLTLNEWL
jgi:two-component system LytT family sensor kinase